MAESLLGGILGEDDERLEGESSDALARAEAFAAAIAAKLAGGDPEVARDTSAFLKEQTELLKVQREHAKDEHALRVAHLRNQLREETVRRLGLRLRVGFQIFLVLIAAAIAVGAAIMIHDAVTSRRVIIEPFDAPAALVARGVTGKVVAGGLLDELSGLQDATRSTAAARGLSSAWTSNIRLDLPETGVSIGEISRLLAERFGHDVHIEGDLVETPTGGLALMVRGNGVPSKTFSGSAMELEKLTAQAAEHVYSKSQPGRWASYLQNVGRNEEAIAFCRAAFNSASKDDQPYLLNVWANSIANSGGSQREALTLYRAALRIKPDYWIAYNNIINALWVLGDEEGAWRVGEDLRKAAGGRLGRAPELYFTNVDTLTWNLGTWLRSTVADAESNAGVGTGLTATGAAIADIQSRLHDMEGADLALKTLKEDPHDPSIGAIAHFVRGRLAAESGDTATAASEMETFGAADADPIVLTNYPGYNCWIAPAEEAAGHPEKADAVLKSAGAFVDCYRFRSDILDGRGDWAGAQQAYAQAVALAPDLPAAYYSWGVALTRRGDLPGALARLKEANQRGPHWADPLKAWGDVLVKQGHTKEALLKYSDALKYAPNWAALKEARAVVAKRTT